MTDAGDLYDRAASTYGQVGPPIFDVLGHRLVELVEPEEGNHGVDIGCGRGAALRPLAVRVSSGHACGVDVSFEMVRQTQGALRSLTPVSAVQSVAEALPLRAGSVDRITCAFTVFWLTEPADAFAEMRRTLSGNGLAAFSMTGGTDPSWAWYGDLLMGYHERYGVLDKQPPGNGLNQQPDALSAALREGGFATITTLEETHTFTFPSFDSWWAFQWTHGARLPLEAMSPQVLARFRQDCLDGIQIAAISDGYQQDWPMVFTLAA